MSYTKGSRLVLIVLALSVVLICAPAAGAEELSALEWYTKGNTYASSGNFEQAAEAFKEVVRLRPELAEAHYNLGLCYQRLGRNGEAVDAFKKVLELNPNIAMAHFSMGISYGRLARWADAVEAFKQGLRLEPKDANAHFYLGGAYVALGDKEAAQAEYELLKKLDPDLAQQLRDMM